MYKVQLCDLYIYYALGFVREWICVGEKAELWAYANDSIMVRLTKSHRPQLCLAKSQPFVRGSIKIDATVNSTHIGKQSIFISSPLHPT